MSTARSQTIWGTAKILLKYLNQLLRKTSKNYVKFGMAELVIPSTIRTFNLSKTTVPKFPKKIGSSVIWMPFFWRSLELMPSKYRESRGIVLCWHYLKPITSTTSACRDIVISDYAGMYFMGFQTKSCILFGSYDKWK